MTRGAPLCPHLVALGRQCRVLPTTTKSTVSGIVRHHTCAIHFGLGFEANTMYAALVAGCSGGAPWPAECNNSLQLPDMFQAAAVGLPVTERYIGIGLAHSRWLSVWLPVHFLLQACHKATTDHRTKPRSEPDEKDMCRHRQACVT